MLDERNTYLKQLTESMCISSVQNTLNYKNFDGLMGFRISKGTPTQSVEEFFLNKPTAPFDSAQSENEWP